jgi:hypothetical protein
MGLTPADYRTLKAGAGRGPGLRPQRYWGCLAKCDLLGRGSERNVYKVEVDGYEEPVAFKIACGRFRQNKTEIAIYKRFSKRWPQYIPRVFDWSEDGRWVETEFLSRVSKAEVEAEHDFRPRNRTVQTKGLPKQLSDFAAATGLLLIEMDWLCHWGRSADGRIKLRDFGALAGGGGP